MYHDGYSEYKWLQALAPQAVTSTATGATIDLLGYQTALIEVNIGDYTGGGAFSVDNRFQLKLEHGNASALGFDGTWSEVYPSQILHSVVGGGGAYSTLNSGIFKSVTSADVSTIAAVGYCGPRRYLRLYISAVGAPSVMSFAATCILGKPGIWPVQDPLPF